MRLNPFKRRPPQRRVIKKANLPPFPELAEAYVPIQDYEPGYDLEEALEKGTLFPSLWRPEFVVPCLSYRRYVETFFEGGPCHD